MSQWKSTEKHFYCNSIRSAANQIRILCLFQPVLKRWLEILTVLLEQQDGQPKYDYSRSRYRRVKHDSHGTMRSTLNNPELTEEKGYYETESSATNLRTATLWHNQGHQNDPAMALRFLVSFSAKRKQQNREEFDLMKLILRIHY